MTITFGETFDKVQECFQETDVSSKLTPKLESITIIRDVYGMIRLFLEPVKGLELQEADIKPLDNLLSQKLSSYYGKDIWFPQSTQDGYEALIKVITEERVLAEWDDETVSPRWYVLERHVAKQAWTNKNAGNPPWEDKYVYERRKPAIVTFFSFKGGVGRTTGLVATALTLARYGHRVAIVDLDLEAPGLSTIFFKDNPGKFGVIDYLLEKKVQQSKWSLKTDILPISEQLLLGDSGETLRLLPAGRIDNNYLEKLARLDFQNLTSNELSETLRGMLKELASVAKPLDFILLDARAGFHDIGGLAVADLSHAAVLFGTQSRQTWSGLTHVIRRLARPLAKDPLPVIMVHALAPPLTASGRNQELENFRITSYDVFTNNYYQQDETVPNQNDLDAAFMPVVVPLEDVLRGDIALFYRDDTPEETSRLLGLINLMTNEPYQGIAKRLCELFERKLDRQNGVEI
ncbi:MAG: AAA family ATPase [Scytonema sp. PMC 1069.18]|nr:AAA family ATPase [Scytonema sp. PMC 1069.18]MEC4883644.1 AAA family ATPase [Scytonema sp. PMC 1070.18]